MAHEITPPPNKNPQGVSQVPVLQQQEKIQTNTSTPGFGEALTRLAMTPTVLGDLGATMMQNAGIEIAKQKGQELGKNPQGELLPPITDIDKAYTESYSAQAQATLGLQAQELLNKGQDEINKANKLSPTLIANYTNNTKAGMQNILDQAPSTVRENLEQQFSKELLNTTHQLNSNMITQQKKFARDQSDVYNDHQISQIHDAELSGDSELAKSTYENTIKNIDANKNIGMYSPTEADTQKEKAKITYQSSIQIKKALDARQKQELEPFLANMIDHKPADMSWTDWESVRNQVVSYVGAVENLDNRNQSLLLAQAGNEITNGTFNASRASYYKDVMSPTHYINTMTSFASSLKSSGIDNTAINNIVSNLGNAEAYVGASPKTINRAYDSVVDGVMTKAAQDGNPISLEEAQFTAASSMARPVPKFIQMVNFDLESGNPNQMLKGLQMYDRLHALNGVKTQGIDSKSLAVGETFRALLGNENTNPIEAAQKAQDTVLNKDPKIIEMNRTKIDEYMNKHVSNSSHAVSWAIKTSGVPSNVPIVDQTAFVANVTGQFASYMQLTNGNEQVSTQMLQKYVAKTYSETEINGAKQLAYLPVDLAIGLPKGATSLIQNDVVNQLKPQFDNMRQAFDNGTSPFYWRIKDRISYEQYSEAKLNLTNIPKIDILGKKNLQGKQEEYQKTVDEYESNKPIEVEQVFKNQKEPKSYNLMVESSTYNQISPITGEVQGDYNLKIRDPMTGIPTAMHGYYGSINTVPSYKPNTQWIREKYISVNGIQTPNYDEWMKNRVQQKIDRANPKAPLFKRLAGAEE